MPDPVQEARHELIRRGLLGDIRTDGVVPDLILRSWRRSVSGSVEASSICHRYQDIDTDSILIRAAKPVLERWQHRLTDTGTTLFLSDRAGSIVARRTSDSSVRRHLDRVHAAEGFDYSEDSIGTNGLGTALAEKSPVYIQGSQHYSDALGTLTCAAVPVFAPAGSVLGSISLGGPSEVATPLMLSLTQEIGQQIEERLRAGSRPQDLALAMSFMRFTNSGRPTVVMDRESLLANTPGLSYVSVSSHVMLWELLNAHDWSAGDTARLALDGTSVEVVARRVLDGPRDHFVLHFWTLEDRIHQPVRRPAAARQDPSATPVARGGVILVDGPPGSGRTTAALAWQKKTSAPTGPQVLTGATLSAETVAEVSAQLAAGKDVLLRQVDQLSDQVAEHVVRLIQEHRTATAAELRDSTLLLTLSAEEAPAVLRSLVDRFGATVRTEALSRTPERIPGLVKEILDRVDPAGRHTISPAALQAFVQWSWPGNITELTETLSALVREVTASVIQRRHLPEHLQHAAPRRQFSLMESAEREAVIRALNAAQGNKSQAAALLGIGRTTLYRHLRRLSLDGDEASL